MDTTNILTMILASFGGASLALLGLSKWLGNIWANRVIEREKLILNKELEKHKSQLDILKRQVLLFNETQFKLYNSLWKSLYDLKKVADDLWETASVENLNKFTSQLRATQQKINQNILIVEDTHYNGLINLINIFWGFQVGKKTLIELRKENGDINNDEIKDTIQNNRHIKENYNNLIFEIAQAFKNQIKGIS